MRKLLIWTLLCCMLIQTDAYSYHRKKRKKKSKRTVVKTSAPKTNVLVVSFISFGGGIDFRSVPLFEKDLKQYNTDNRCNLVYEAKNWGREGERDYCITGGTSSCLDNFIIHVKKMYNGNDRILIKENATCRQ